MPGTDPAESLRVVLGELPDLPYLPELPARGAGADLTGRTAALLVDIPVETTPSGWRVTAREGRDLRRARSFLARDLDTLEEIAAGYQGPFKIQVCGPWTLAATIELAASQNPVLGDAGAARDLIASLAEGVAAHAADVAKRLPGARLLVQHRRGGAAVQDRALLRPVGAAAAHRRGRRTRRVLRPQPGAAGR